MILKHNYHPGKSVPVFQLFGYKVSNATGHTLVCGQRFGQDNLLSSMYVYSIFMVDSRLSRNSEAFASELLEMFPLYGLPVGGQQTHVM